jgi:hypothetical protein
VSGTTTLVSTDTAIPTGGPFAANATQAGTLTLKKGTYLVSVNGKARASTSSAVEIFPQFFVYDQVKNTNFTGDLLNVGAGALPVNNTSIDSYYSGYGQITLPADTTLHVYAFGYDGDRSASQYTLENLSVTATQVTPAG